MINTSILIADVKLNEKQDYKEMIVIKNGHGILCVDRELYSISFNADQEPKDIGVDIKYKKFLAEL